MRSEIITQGRRLNDLGLALVESVHAAGGNDEDARRIFGDDLLKRRLGLLVMGQLKLGQFPSEAIAAHLIPEYTDASGKKRKWEITEDAEPRDFSVANLEFIRFLRNGESYLVGKDFRTRAEELNAGFSLGDGAKMLKDPDALNAVAEGVNYIPLTRTVLRVSVGGLYIAFLYRDGDGRWGVGFHGVGHDWHGVYRLPRCKS